MKTEIQKTKAKMLNARVNDKHVIEIELGPQKTLVDHEDFLYRLSRLDGHHFHLIVGHQSYNVEVIKADHSRKEFFFKINGSKVKVSLQDRFDQLIEAMGMQEEEDLSEKQVLAPMPGLVLQVHVAEGQPVEKGAPLVTLEAMKMENVLKAPADGVVGKIMAQTGKSVEKNYLLLEME